MRQTVYHVALEPIEARYSAQWLECINREFMKFAKANGNRNLMFDLLGDTTEDSKPTTGGFLDFIGTNKWKAQQVVKIANLFNGGYVVPNDVFLFTDAWNPAILQVRYMSDLMNIPVRIVSYWHAGSYDPTDVLGYKIKDKRWSLAAEESFFWASDVNLFATEFHRDMFIRNCIGYKDGQMMDVQMRCTISGQPHYEILKWFDEPKNCPPSWDDRKNWIVFPHRMAPEKHPEIFEKLSEMMPEYEFIFTAGYGYTKDEYYKLLQQSKIVFSCAEHENLGISMMEGVLAGCLPLVPNRACYPEIYPKEFTYVAGDEQTTLGNAASHIQSYMAHPNRYLTSRNYLRNQLRTKYLTSVPMWEALIAGE